MVDLNLYDLLVYKKMNSSGGGDIDVESLSVTENGSYNAGEGKAYNPVIVNVPEPTLKNKSITANGTYQASSDNADGYSSVDVHVAGYKITDVSGLPSPIATFTDGAPLPMPKLEVAVEPQQDLHGYDAPWVGGAGKNKFNMGSKWSGTASGLTFNTDDNYVTINGTKNGGTYVTANELGFELSAGTYYVKTIIIGGTASNQPQLTLIGNDISTGDTIGNERTFTLSDTTTVSVRFAFWNDGATFNNYKLGIVVSKTPNIDKFYPYSNICPISGWSAVDVTVADDVDNPTTTKTITIQLGDTYYGGKLDVVSGVLTLTHGYIASYNGETLPSTWISDRDVYVEGTSPTTGAQVVYELATPTTIQLTPTAVKSLLGSNNLWANTGDVLEASYWEEL